MREPCIGLTGKSGQKKSPAHEFFLNIVYFRHIKQVQFTYIGPYSKLREQTCSSCNANFEYNEMQCSYTSHINVWVLGKNHVESHRIGCININKIKK